jgi:hypothetical protein
MSEHDLADGSVEDDARFGEFRSLRFGQECLCGLSLLNRDLVEACLGCRVQGVESADCAARDDELRTASSRRVFESSLEFRVGERSDGDTNEVGASAQDVGSELAYRVVPCRLDHDSGRDEKLVQPLVLRAGQAVDGAAAEESVQGQTRDGACGDSLADLASHGSRSDQRDRSIFRHTVSRVGLIVRCMTIEEVG